jgi:hypothetical protein
MIMLSSNLQSILDNRIRYLPEITGKAINSIDWSTKLIEIGKKFGLHVDEMEEFQGVVLKSMIGMIPPEKFEDELISALALSPANAEKVIEEINNEILEPIHDFVMNKGKAADPLKTAGIIVETAAEEPTMSIPIQENSISIPKPPSYTADSQESQLPVFEVPASPEPTSSKPLIHGNFSAVFTSGGAQPN